MPVTSLTLRTRALYVCRILPRPCSAHRCNRNRRCHTAATALPLRTAHHLRALPYAPAARAAYAPACFVLPPAAPPLYAALDLFAYSAMPHATHAPTLLPQTYLPYFMPRAARTRHVRAPRTRFLLCAHFAVPLPVAGCRLHGCIWFATARCAAYYLSWVEIRVVVSMIAGSGGRMAVGVLGRAG